MREGFFFLRCRLGGASPDDSIVRDRIESKRHKIKKTNQNPFTLPDNVVPFPNPRPNQEKIFDLCEDLFCGMEKEKEGSS